MTEENNDIITGSESTQNEPNIVEQNQPDLVEEVVAEKEGVLDKNSKKESDENENFELMDTDEKTV